MIFFIKVLIIILLEYHCYSYAVFPFKSFNKCKENQNIKLDNKNKASNLFIHNCLTNYIYTELNIGVPQQTINTFFSMKGSSFYIFEDFCPQELMTFYNYNKSGTFINSSFCTNNFNNIETICNIKEKISFYNDINLLTNSSLNEMEMGFGRGLPSYIKNNSTNNVCGYIGFSLMNKDISNLLNRFMLFLKFFLKINDYTWTFHFFDKNNKNDLFYKINDRKKIDDNNGLFIIGSLPHQYYNQSFNEKDYKLALNENRGYFSKWDLKFFDIYFYDNNNNKIKMNNYLQGELDIETNYIISTKEYFDLIKEKYFNYYINKNICINETVEVGKSLYNINNDFYEIISCDINLFTEKEKKKFPSLYFYHLKYNYTYVLNYKELFNTIYNRTFFLITWSKTYECFWTFGQLFMKKYQFIFDSDKKTIGFYKEMKNEHIKTNKNSKIKYFVFFIITIIFSVLTGIYLGRRIYKRNKSIVTELNNDLEYNATDNKNIKIEKNIEMKSKLIY